MNIRNAAVLIWLAAGIVAEAALAGGIGDGTLPFHGQAMLLPDALVRLELHHGTEESKVRACAGDALGVAGKLEIKGAAYPVLGACMLANQEVRVEVATVAEPIELLGRFEAEGFVGTMQWGGQAPTPVRFSPLR